MRHAELETEMDSSKCLYTSQLGSIETVEDDPQFNRVWLSQQSFTSSSAGILPKAVD